MSPRKNFKKHADIVNAFLKGLRRKDIEINLQVHDGYIDDAETGSGKLVFEDKILGYLSIRASDFGVDIGVQAYVPSDKDTPDPRTRGAEYSLTNETWTINYSKNWKRFVRKGKRHIRPRRRPKFRKFGAYIASQLMMHHSLNIATDIMES